MIVHCGLSVLSFNGEKWSTLYQNLTVNVQDHQMRKQQSCIKENIHVLLLWRSHYQKGKGCICDPIARFNPTTFCTRP
jgi:predicted lactoylglutathione lyase